MENPELSGIDNYYINLKHLLSVQQSEENQLKQDIDRLYEKVKDIKDENLLETINYQINNLVKNFRESVLEPIEIQTTNKDLIEFKGLVVQKLIYFQNKKE